MLSVSAIMNTTTAHFVTRDYRLKNCSKLTVALLVFIYNFDDCLFLQTKFSTQETYRLKLSADSTVIIKKLNFSATSNLNFSSLKLGGSFLRHLHHLFGLLFLGDLKIGLLGHEFDVSRRGIVS